MESLRIVALAVAAAIVYGIAHDLVTAHVCVEYFTVGHPRIIDSQSPVALALAWGVVATWWVGLPLGGLLALAARVGSAPKWTARRLVRPIAALLGVMAVCALLSGLLALSFTPHGVEFIVGGIARGLPEDRRIPFLVDAFAHSASYVVGALGGVVLAAWVLRRRRRERDNVVANS